MSIPGFSGSEDLQMEELRSLLSDRLRYERKKLGLTQEAFATRCGVTIRTYKRFELGECDSLEVFLRIVVSFKRTIAIDLLFPPPVVELTPRTPAAALARLEKKRRPQS